MSHKRPLGQRTQKQEKDRREGRFVYGFGIVCAVLCLGADFLGRVMHGGAN